MGKFSFPSCLCFSSSSPTGNSTQPSQHPASAGPSTPSSATLPSQQPVNVGPSTATAADFESFLKKFNGLSQLHDLIRFIEELLKIALGEKNEEGSSSAASSYIQDGQTFLELVDKHISKVPQKNDSIDGASTEIEKVVINMLKGAGKIHWVGAALSVVGFVLARYGEMRNNQRECLEILKVMVNLGKQIVDLNQQMPEQEEKLQEAVQCIVVGCSMCASQLATAKVFRFLTASVNADGLKAFKAKIDRLYDDLTLSAVIEIQNRLPKIASLSKIAYKPAVGIESGLERVIQLVDLNAQNTSAQVVVVYGFGGIGKTTLADAVYDRIDPQTYKKWRIHIDQNCTRNDLRVLQENLLEKLFNQKVKLADCDHGKQTIWSVFKKNPDQPLFLYIDNGLKMTDIRQLLPEDLGSCLPPRSRLLVTTRNLQETDIFVFWNVQRQHYLVHPLPDSEARKILLNRASDYNDEHHILDLLKLCGGVPLLLELAGAQLAISSNNTNIMVLELLKAGEKVQDISDCMVDFVYNRLLEPVKEAFLDITSFFYTDPHSRTSEMDSIEEEEFRALEEASFIKRSENGFMTIHDIVQARGKKLSEENRITDPETLLDCLNDVQRLKNLKGIYFREKREQPTIEINADHLKCMSNSLRVLSYSKISPITFVGKCHKPFKQLRCLFISRDIPDLPMEFEKLEHLTYYYGPFTQDMSLYQLPPSLRHMYIPFHAEKGVADSQIPPTVTSSSSLIKLSCSGLESMQMLPDGLEKLTKLEELSLGKCHQSMEFPSEFGELKNLKRLSLYNCNELKELPQEFGQLNNLERLVLFKCPQMKELLSDIGRLSNLTVLLLQGCSSLTGLPPSFVQLNSLTSLELEGCSALNELPPNFGQLNNLTSLELEGCSALNELPPNFGQLNNLTYLDLKGCSALSVLPSEFGQLNNLTYLDLKGCSALSVLPSEFGQLKNLQFLYLSQCSGLKELPSDFGQLQNLEILNLSHCSGLKELPAGFGQLDSLGGLVLSHCSGLKELPSDFGQLKNLRELDLSQCLGIEEWPSSFKDLTGIKRINLRGCLKLKESLPNYISENCAISFD